MATDDKWRWDDPKWDKEREGRPDSWRAPLRWHGPWYQVPQNVEFFIGYFLGVLAWLMWGVAHVMVRAEDAKPLLRNGDLVVFSGIGVPQTLGTKMMSGTNKSHAAVVVLIDGEPFILEASTAGDTVFDVITETIGKDGVRVVPFAEKIREYYAQYSTGPATVFPLLVRSKRGLVRPALATQNWGATGEEWLRKFVTKKFDGNVLSLMGAQEEWIHSPFLGGVEEATVKDNSVFCSETVAHYLRKIGVLQKSTRSDKQFSPADFMSPNSLRLNFPYHYGTPFNIR